jgi:peptidylprolyl isomerase
MKKSILHAIVPVAVLAGLTCAVLPALSQWTGNNPIPSGQKVIKTPSGLQYYDIKVGNGPSPTNGSTVTVNYTGWLTNKTKFDSSLDRHQPFEFPIGQKAVIAGWDEGVATMKVGGKRRLVIPPDLAYGSRGAPPSIPANSTLVFDVELLRFK